MLCALVGALVYVSSDEQRWHAFLAPLVRLFVIEPGPGRRMRLLVLSLAPLVSGWMVWQEVSPAADVPTAIRLQHPTQPAEYAALENPQSRLSPDEAREGTILYQKNCRPCHGAAADGTGPLARGLRLRPVDFTDGGTIASVVESYPFWRVREGNAGMPDIATPWNSAMPAWQDELSDDDIWRIVATEYVLSGTEPRRPEGERP
jgi:mono/diheme cytochrome c family protein